MGAAYSVVAQVRLADCSGGIARSLWTIAATVTRRRIPPEARSRQATFGSALLFAALGAASSEAASPYSPSNRITGIQWHLDSYQATEEGGDIWPVTWAANGSLLAAWGDGVVVCPQKASYGVAAIASDQPSVDMTSVHCGPGPDSQGKMMAIVATNGAVYARVNPQDGSTSYPIWKSLDGGSTWTQPSAPLAFLLDSFLQFGRANQGAPGGYVYALEPWETEIRLVRVAAGDLYLSVLVLAELRKGIEQLRRREEGRASTLERWLADVDIGFGGRILPIDREIADCWGRMAATRPVPVIDGLLAATAKVHGLVLVTRNSRQVDGLGAAILNPFEPVMPPSPAPARGRR